MDESVDECSLGIRMPMGIGCGDCSYTSGCYDDHCRDDLIDIPNLSSLIKSDDVEKTQIFAYHK